MNALSMAVPVVRLGFVLDLLACAKGRQELPDPATYAPRLDEPTLNCGETELSCAADAASRRTLFRGKRFVFADAAQAGKYEKAIGYAGGEVVIAKDEECGIKVEHTLP